MLAQALEFSTPTNRRPRDRVFGSAGLRDREKRKMMAEVSAKSADITILLLRSKNGVYQSYIGRDERRGAVASGN